MTRPEYKYTIGFVYCAETDQVLLLNRQKAPWMGRWNGVGGKLDAGESPLACIIRETFEETGLQLPQYVSRGVITWEHDGQDLGGAYLFTAKVTKEQVDAYGTPRVHCHEGILDWKTLSWARNEHNTGVVDNIRGVLQNLWEALPNAVFATRYRHNVLQKVEYLQATE